jgi:hypothetical protein
LICRARRALALIEGAICCFSQMLTPCGDAAVAAAMEHIQKYESRHVIKTEHARRVDADVS